MIVSKLPRPPACSRAGLAGFCFRTECSCGNRVVVFVDYQNGYRRARDAFHDHRADPHWMGQVNPTALGALVVELAGDPQYELHQVRIYRGLPDPRRDPHGNRAAHRQIAAWRRDPAVTVNTRTFQYPRNYPASPPQEKGIDVQLALDFAMMAVRDEYDVGILMSNDTDLRPALEEVMNLGSQTVEVAAWEPLPAVNDTGFALPDRHRKDNHIATGSTIAITSQSRTQPTTPVPDSELETSPPGQWLFG